MHVFNHPIVEPGLVHMVPGQGFKRKEKLQVLLKAKLNISTHAFGKNRSQGQPDSRKREIDSTLHGRSKKITLP